MIDEKTELTNRERRQAKALAVVKAIQPQLIQPEPVPYNPPRPDPTYTFWRHPNDTFPMGKIVYFMYSAGRIKIGYSVGLRDRQIQLKTMGPFPPVVILVVRGSEESEKHFHEKFASDRLHGEWFNFSSKVRNFLRLRLCEVGRTSLAAAEAEFRDYSAAFLDGYRAPTKTRKVSLCSHGKPSTRACAACERQQALDRLDRLNAHLANPDRDPSALDHEWISKPRTTK